MTLDVMSNSPFVSQAIGMENLVVNQMSLAAFFHAPIQFCFAS